MHDGEYTILYTMHGARQRITCTSLAMTKWVLDSLRNDWHVTDAEAWGGGEIEPLTFPRPLRGKPRVEVIETSATSKTLRVHL